MEWQPSREKKEDERYVFCSYYNFFPQVFKLDERCFHLKLQYLTWRNTFLIFSVIASWGNFSHQNEENTTEILK